jgi:glycosyltransferase involved in cell wall biosynthesis
MVAIDEAKVASRPSKSLKQKSGKRMDDGQLSEHGTSTHLTRERIVAVIPAYNEERFIGSVVLQTLPYVRTVIVVDDGSTDQTAGVAQAAGAVIIRHPKNLGKGAALNTGFEAATEYRSDAIVTLDADSQHNPAELSKIVAPVLNDEADIVIGSRYLDDKSGVPRIRIWGHQVINLITRFASGETSTDSQSGYRAFSSKALDSTYFASSGFSVESEMQFIAKEHKMRLKEVRITVQYPDKPKRNIIAHGMSVLNGVLNLIGQYRPLLFFGVLGILLLLFGLFLGSTVVIIHSRTDQLAVGYAMLSVLSTILGSLSLVTGIILHSVRGLLHEKLKSSRGR